MPADGDQASDALTVLRTQNEPPGFGPPLHRHRDAAEASFVLEGEYLMFLGDEQHSCPPGAFVYVPRHVPHTFKVSSEGGRKLNFFTPVPDGQSVLVVGGGGVSDGRVTTSRLDKGVGQWPGPRRRR